MNELAPLDQIDILIQESLDQDNPSIVLSEIKRMLQVRELVGKALAKTLYLLHQNWYNFSLSQTESFNDTIELWLSLHPHTVQRYVKWWHYQEQLPEQLENKPIREQIPITNAIAQGYEFEEEDWDKLERATNLSEVHGIIREVKGKEPRQSSLQIYVNQTGTLYCWYNQERYNIGYLDLKNEDEAVIRAIERIIREAGVIEK
jgi:hypothetical protein